MEEKDRLEEMWELQTGFMERLRLLDKMPEWPLDLTTKAGQRLIKEVMFNGIEELMEASMTLKNKMHRMTDARLYDRDHYIEELGDAWAYFMELCILSGITPEMLFQEYKRKNKQVVDRLERGY